MSSKAPTIRDSVDRFIAEIHLSRSPATVKTYGSGLEIFQRYLRQARVDPNKIPVTSVTAHHLIDYPAWLKGEHFRRRKNPHSVATYIAVVMSWLRYLIREKLHAEIAEEMERIREAYRPLRPKGRRLPRTLKDEVIEKIAEACRKRKPGRSLRLRTAQLRDQALIESLRSTGARISEVLGSNVEDLDTRSRALRVLGKGSKERLVYYDTPAWNALQHYLSERQTLKLTTSGKETPLLARHDRGSGRYLKCLSPDGARKILQTYAKGAGIKERVTPHRYRHSFGLAVLESTGDLAATQDLLGHASPATTRIYAPLVSSRLRAAHRKAFPR